MGEKIVVGPINRGFKNDRTPFVIDNDSFPTLINAYQWRGRIKRKRGTSLLGRLKRFFNSLNSSYGSTTTITLSGSGVGNILTGFGLQTNGNIVPGSVTITAPGPTVYTDPAMDGTLSPSGTINYSSGVIKILEDAGQNVSVSFNYYPDLPVMGLEDFYRSSVQFPLTIAFDTKYSYNVVTSDPYPIYDVSFYKNPSLDPVNLPGYVRKTVETPTSWNGQDYQQFWTTNYQGAMWATNGITVPFTTANIGMQFKAIATVTVLTLTTANLSIIGHGLVVGDFVFVNEVVGTTGINYQTGYVTTVVDVDNVIVTFPFATLTTNGTGGIAQYLTNRSDVTKDCIRFYDGDPTDGNVITPNLTGVNGWVNFAPPLSIKEFSIADVPEDQYYLVGARMILPFKDRLLFFGPVIQSSTAAPIYLQDTVIYSQNGTPYYTVSFTNKPSAVIDNPTSITNVYHSILLPVDQTSTASAWFEDQTGFGGFVSAGVDQPLITVAANGDVLITGFNFIQARLVYSGNDIQPFNFFLIDNEWGSGSTFSVINMGKGVFTRGSRGYVNTTQEVSGRIDLEIPDQVFEIRLNDNGTERFTAQRDFINEWIYFTYTSNQETYKFPNQTLQYNYRDDTWAIFNEAYTHYGLFRKQTGFTWQTVGLVYPTWDSWNEPWNGGSSTLLQPEVIAGNQQGFILVRDDGTNEGNSLYIQNISGSVVTSPNHTLNIGDYITITGVFGTIGGDVNGKIFSVQSATANTFRLNPTISGTETYLGGGLIKRMYVPFIQTKQFPPSWGMSRKVRLGVQQYLLTTTNRSQIQLLIYLSQNSDSPYNQGAIVPALNSVNNSLIYSTVLFTCPESVNLGLTPANINLNMVTAVSQSQIWHRVSTSLIGDTVQLGFTMSDEQMRHMDQLGTPAIITNIALGYPTVFTAVNTFRMNQLIMITGVLGTTELNNDTYIVTAVTGTTFTLQVDSTLFTAYVSGGLAEREVFVNQFAEIELHGFTIDVTPSQVLA